MKRDPKLSDGPLILAPFVIWKVVDQPAANYGRCLQIAVREFCLSSNQLLNYICLLVVPLLDRSTYASLPILTTLPEVGIIFRQPNFTPIWVGFACPPLISNIIIGLPLHRNNIMCPPSDRNIWTRPPTDCNINAKLK